MTAGKEQSDNSSATSRRNSDCLTALFLFLINFLKLQDSHFFRELSSKTMTSDRYMSWTLCGGSKLTPQRPFFHSGNLYKVDESEPDHRFPSQSNEKRGHWVGFAENKGDQLTWKILSDDTNTIIIRSAVRSATKTSPNLRLDPPQGEDQPQDLTSDVFVYGRPNPDGSDTTPPMSIINFDDLLGRTFLLPMDENGERMRATISEHVKDLYQQQVSREDQLRFKLKIDGDQLGDLISYNQLMEYLEDETDTGPLEDGFYRFKCIKDHKGPYTSSDPEYNGSSYNLLIEWETGEQTWEPLSNIIASDPYTCAVYAKEHDLLNTPGWELLKRHARTARRLIRTLKKSKYRQARASRNYKHGWEVQEIMHMHYNLIYTMATTSGRKLLIWRMSKSKNIKYSKILERLSMTRTRLPMHQRDTRRSEYTLYLMSNTVENSRLDL